MPEVFYYICKNYMKLKNIMKKILFLTILAIQNIAAQIISYDNSFASNGKFTITNASNQHYINLTATTDGSLYFTYAKESNIGTTFLSKLNTNGTIDSSFGNSGEVSIPYFSPGFPSILKKQTDGKLLVLGFYEDGTAITRVLPNGQIDLSFGINGTSKIPYIGMGFNTDSFGIHLQNNKLIVYGTAFDSNYHLLNHSLIYRLNENGTIDQSFGNNGSINTKGNFIFVDNQSNIISFISNVINTNVYPYGALEKYNSNGQVFSGFGNNGVLAFNSSLGMVNTAFMDSNNYIVCANINNEIFRIHPTGVYDTSFIFDNNAPPFNDGNLSLYINEKNGNYYTSWITGSTGENILISKLTSTGSIDPSFNYSENTTAPLIINQMIINDNNIFATRGNQILKFSLNNPTLATINPLTANNTSISFENPVRQNLIYQAKEKISKIELYSSAGKIVKVLKDSFSPVSELPKGIYTAKITFENGSITTKKLIKN